MLTFRINVPENMNYDECLESINSSLVGERAFIDYDVAVLDSLKNREILVVIGHPDVSPTDTTIAFSVS